jgi:hypothetical protein
MEDGLHHIIIPGVVAAINNPVKPVPAPLWQVKQVMPSAKESYEVVVTTDPAQAQRPLR